MSGIKVSGASSRTTLRFVLRHVCYGSSGVITRLNPQLFRSPLTMARRQMHGTGAWQAEAILPEASTPTAQTLYPSPSTSTPTSKDAHTAGMLG